MQAKSENNTKLIHRLGEFVTKKGISFNQLAIALGLSNSYFSKMVKGSGSVGSDVVEKILRMHPDLSADWLLLGVGPMLRTELPVQPASQVITHERDQRDVELISTQKLLIASLQQRIRDLEQGHFLYTEGFPTVPSAGDPYTKKSHLK